ncbi:MAG TPA: DUF4384 domain-containing protein [Gemmatimonadales bacterium]|nr:DUF4384 domain-containing protein [Gemmatimonadales bacterium]
MLIHIALLALAVSPTPARRYSPIYRPRVELWTNRGDGAVFSRGERVRVYFRLDQDAYVTIFRVDTDGRVRILFPREPWEDNFARGGREFEIDGQQLHSDAFTIEDYPGVGYLFAVAAADAFIYDGIQTGDHWDYRVIADGRVRGDPYVAMTDLAQRIVPDGYADWDYDVVTYNVEQHYDYPRFLCYDCHSYVSYSYWNPYHASCVRFRMYVYDDPWYYPYRYYGGDRVVFVRPYRPEPRFIFKDWGSSRPNRDEFVTRERERPVNDNTRRGVTGQDLGGRGVIPPPAGRPINDNTRRETTGGREIIPSQDGRDRRDNPARDRTGDRPDLIERPDRQGDARRVDQPRAQPTVREIPRTVEPRVIEPRRDEPRRDEPRRVEPRAEPRRDEPRRVEPRAEPRREEQVRQQRSEPRAEPRREQPRNEPRAEARRSSPPPAPPSPARNEPEVRRRKP